MSKDKPSKKKVVSTKNKEGSKSGKKVVSTKKKVVPSQKKSPISPTSSRGRSRSRSTTPKVPFLFDKKNYLYMGIGVGLIIIGMALMAGGSMPEPNVWDENRIYGFRRTVLAPLVILAGLILQIVAIFKK